MKKPSIKQLLGKGEAQNEITESLRKMIMKTVRIRIYGIYLKQRMQENS